MKKKYYLICLTALLGCLLVKPGRVMAQSEKALLCDNGTLYFVYDNTSYSSGSPYTDNDGNTSNIVTVTTDFHAQTWSVITSTPQVNTQWGDGSTIRYIDFQNSYNDCSPTRLRYWFQYLSNLEEVKHASNLKLTSTLDLTGAFYYCTSLTTINVSDWDMTAVMTIESLFCFCESLSSLDVRDWTFTRCTNMQSAFYKTNISTLDVSNWNMTPVKKLNSTFGNCTNLQTLNVSGWDVSSVTDMHGLFGGCNQLQSLNVSSWNTGNVTDMSQMFENCSSLKSLDVSGWNTAKVNYMTKMFNQCGNLTGLTFGTSFVMTSTAKSNCTYMFQDCQKLRYIDFYRSNDTHAITSFSRYYGQFAYVPKTTVIYLPHESQDLKYDINVVYSYGGDGSDLRCSNYYSEDKVDIELPHKFLTNKAEYYRTMSTTYGSVILPYAFTTNDDIQAYTLDEEHIPTMYFKDTQDVDAHTPFAFKKLSDTTPTPFIMQSSSWGIEVKATHTTSHEEEISAGTPGFPYTATTILPDWETKGYYINETVVCDGSDYSGVFYISGDKFYEADGPLTLYPHRVTFHGIWEKPIPGSSNYGTTGTRTFEITTVSDSQIADAIDAAELRMTEREASDIYDVQGRRHSAMQRGINIVRMKDGSVRKTMVK